MSYPVDRFAAHLAHLLNPPDPPGGVVTLDPGRLYATLTTTLSGRLHARELLHHPSYAWRMLAEEAAMAYFDATIARRLRLSGRAVLSVAHRTFAALVERGSDPVWARAEVGRRKQAARDDDSAMEAGKVVTMLPVALRHVRDALAAVPQDIGAGNAAATIRARHGPLSLVAGSSVAIVAEEMSLWDAILCSPPQLKALAPGEAFNRFCSVVIDAMRTANRPVQELLGLGRGLCPFDWVDQVPVNQVRALRRFLAALPDAGSDTPAAWAAAFAQAPVPNHGSAKALWDAPIGQALRGARAALGERLAADCSGADNATGEMDEEDDTPRFLDREAFAAGLARIGAGQGVDAQEQRLLMLLHEGRSLCAAVKETGLDAVLAERGLDFAAYVADLYHRIHAARAATERELT